MLFASMLSTTLVLFAAGLQTAGELPKIPRAHHCPVEITAWRVYNPNTNRAATFAISFHQNVVGFSLRFYGPRVIPGPNTVIRPCNKRSLSSFTKPDPHDVCAPEAADPNPNAEFFYAVKRKTEFHPIDGEGYTDLHLLYARWVEFDEIDFEGGHKWKSSSKSTCAFVLENPSPEDRKRSVMEPMRRVDLLGPSPRRPNPSDHN